MRIFLFCILSFSISAASADGTQQIKKKIHDLCMSRFSRTLDTRKATCDCSVKNLALKNNESELKFIYQVLKSKKTPKKTNDEQEMLVEYSRNVSEKCLQNPKWVVNE